MRTRVGTEDGHQWSVDAQAKAAGRAIISTISGLFGDLLCTGRDSDLDASNSNGSGVRHGVEVHAARIKEGAQDKDLLSDLCLFEAFVGGRAAVRVCSANVSEGSTVAYWAI